MTLNPNATSEPRRPTANFVPVGVLDPRAHPSHPKFPVPPTTKTSNRDLLRGLVKQAPFVAKNSRLYFQNAWRTQILRTKVVAPYAITFYVTHKCNLDCSYCTQKEPDVFSAELPTAETMRLLN